MLGLLAECAAGAHRLRRHSGRNHGARRAVPYDAREHRAADHGRAGDEHARGSRSRGARVSASMRFSRTGGKRGRVPELWDGHAAERIADDLAAVAGSDADLTAGGCKRMSEAQTGERRRRQCDDDRRGGLLPGLCLRTVHRSRRRWDSMPCRVEAQRGAHPGPAERSRRARDVLHARLGRRALSGARSPHRAGGTRGRKPRLRAFAGDRARGRSVPRRHQARQGHARGHLGTARPRLSGAELFGGPRQPLGVRLHRRWPVIATARASTRFATITTACPTRRASRTKCGPDLLEVPVATVRIMAQELAGGRRRATSACCLTSFPDGRCGGSTRSTACPPCSTCIRGSSIPINPASPALTQRRVFATI